MRKVMFKWLAMFLAVVLCAGVVSCKDDATMITEHPAIVSWEHGDMIWIQCLRINDI